VKVPAELLTIARALSGLERPVAFVGGMVGPLLLTDTGAAPPRATKDVDLVVRVDSLADYYDLAEKLRARGLMELPLEGAPICRWVHAGIPVDVMPTEPAVLGFGNPWYGVALEHPRTIVHDGVSIPIVDASHFVATKLEAWLARGDDDVLHHDLEDVMTVIDGRPELVVELEAAAVDLRAFVARQLARY
jgi:predicted nucleotidyltransferase